MSSFSYLFISYPFSLVLIYLIWPYRQQHESHVSLMFHLFWSSMTFWVWQGWDFPLLWLSTVLVILMVYRLYSSVIVAPSVTSSLRVCLPSKLWVFPSLILALSTFENYSLLQVVSLPWECYLELSFIHLTPLSTPLLTIFEFLFLSFFAGVTTVSLDLTFCQSFKIYVSLFKD